MPNMTWLKRENGRGDRGTLSPSQRSGKAPAQVGAPSRFRQVTHAGGCWSLANAFDAGDVADFVAASPLPRACPPSALAFTAEPKIDGASLSFCATKAGACQRGYPGRGVWAKRQLPRPHHRLTSPRRSVSARPRVRSAAGLHEQCRFRRLERSRQAGRALRTFRQPAQTPPRLVATRPRPPARARWDSSPILGAAVAPLSPSRWTPSEAGALGFQINPLTRRCNSLEQIPTSCRVEARARRWATNIDPGVV